MKFKTIRDFSKVPNYLERKMFLDDAGAVTIQRYEEYAYPVIAKFDETARGFYWVPEEIELKKDEADFKSASEEIKHIFTSNLLRQTTLDSELGVEPARIFIPPCSVPELTNLVTTWTFFEQIHSRAYSHIIRNIYNVPKTEFDKIHDTSDIMAMASSIGQTYQDLHLVNCRKSLSEVDTSITPPTEYEYIKAIWRSIIASYGLEGIRFTVSFATSLAMVENKLFVGNGNEISLILADEMLHKDFTKYLINILPKIDPRFKEVSETLKQESFDMLVDVADEEKRWSKYLFKKGSIVGLNDQTMCDLVDYTTHNVLKDIKMNYQTQVKTNPTPWFAKHFNTNKKQTALQENESTAYLMNSLTNDIDLSELPKF